ncbi:MAG: ABC transporter permease [Clostridia bacterium]|nr:ABC transporter permease [Clostridia bacterium]
MKTYLKTLLRAFQKHILRFLSLVFMVLISIGFISGIGSLRDKINYSVTKYYKDQRVSDFIVRCTEEGGFDERTVENLKDTFGEGSEYNRVFQLDVPTGEKLSVRLLFLDFENWTVNVPTFIEGEKQDGANPHKIYADKPDNVIKGYSVGDKVDIARFLDGVLPSALLDMLDLKVEVCAVVQSPLTFANDGEPSDYAETDGVPDTTTATKDLDVLENILYIPKSLLSHPATGEKLLHDNALYIAIENRDTFSAFSKNYKSFVNAKCEEAADEGIKVLTLYDNYSFQSVYSYGNKVADIGFVIMVAFLLVTALVVFSTMTRLIEEERSQIACLKTLGYSSVSIVSKYMLFALVATGIGGFGAYFVGIGITRLLYYIFNYSFTMPPISMHVAIIFYVITVTVIVAGTLIATAITGFKMASERPAELLRPRPPKAGKKVILERLPFLWKRLSFKYKSTLRNVLRFKSRFIMTVLAVAISTALVLVGLGLLDLCIFHDFGSGAIMGIAFVVIIFAGLLNIVVIYTLTNINISERNREIATLMVLGYQNYEVTGYIYREIFINSFIGILFGYPLSCLLNLLVFSVMGVGTLGGITWFWWIVTPLIVLLFTALVALALRSKIVKVDMNESLKAIE